MKFEIRVEGRIIDDVIFAAERMESHFDRIADELARFDATDHCDASLDMTIAAHTFAVSLYVEAENLDEASARAFAFVRSALHGAGLGTSEWSQGWSYRLERSAAEAAEVA